MSTLRPLTVDWREWNAVVADFPEATVFHRAEWLQASENSGHGNRRPILAFRHKTRFYYHDAWISGV
ncbi:MAG: hypothetical protein ACUVX8_02890 [Candidatus Zipacnadales bacterium]